MINIIRRKSPSKKAKKPQKSKSKPKRTDRVRKKKKTETANRSAKSKHFKTSFYSNVFSHVDIFCTKTKTPNTIVDLGEVLAPKGGGSLFKSDFEKVRDRIL